MKPFLTGAERMNTGYRPVMILTIRATTRKLSTAALYIISLSPSFASNVWQMVNKSSAAVMLSAKLQNSSLPLCQQRQQQQHTVRAARTGSCIFNEMAACSMRDAQVLRAAAAAAACNAHNDNKTVGPLLDRLSRLSSIRNIDGKNRF